MNIESIETAYLSTAHGKYVCMQKPRQSHQLVAENLQGKGPEVKVYHILYNGATKCMAFCFEVDKNSVFPFVTRGEEVKFRVLPRDKPITPGILDRKYLFKWGEQDSCGDCRSLNSVAEPSKYLSEEKGEMIIKTQPETFFQILRSDKKRANVELRSARSGKIQKIMTTQCRKNTCQKRHPKYRPSCCEGSVAPTKRLYCPERDAKRKKYQ